MNTQNSNKDAHLQQLFRAAAQEDVSYSEGKTTHDVLRAADATNTPLVGSLSKLFQGPIFMTLSSALAAMALSVAAWHYIPSLHSNESNSSTSTTVTNSATTNTQSTASTASSSSPSANQRLVVLQNTKGSDSTKHQIVIANIDDDAETILVNEPEVVVRSTSKKTSSPGLRNTRQSRVYIVKNSNSADDATTQIIADSIDVQGNNLIFDNSADASNSGKRHRKMLQLIAPSDGSTSKSTQSISIEGTGDSTRRREVNLNVIGDADAQNTVIDIGGGASMSIEHDSVIAEGKKVKRIIVRRSASTEDFIGDDANNNATASNTNGTTIDIAKDKNAKRIVTIRRSKRISKDNGDSTLNVEIQGEVKQGKKLNQTMKLGQADDEGIFTDTLIAVTFKTMGNPVMCDGSIKHDFQGLADSNFIPTSKLKYRSLPKLALEKRNTVDADEFMLALGIEKSNGHIVFHDGSAVVVPGKHIERTLSAKDDKVQLDICITNDTTVLESKKSKVNFRPMFIVRYDGSILEYCDAAVNQSGQVNTTAFPMEKYKDSCVSVVVHPDNKTPVFLLYYPTQDFLNALPREKALQVRAEQGNAEALRELQDSYRGCKYMSFCSTSNGAIEDTEILGSMSSDTRVKISLKEPRTMRVALYDIVGRLVAEVDKGTYYSAGQHIIPLLVNQDVHQAATFYLLTITTDAGEKVSQRVVLGN